MATQLAYLSDAELYERDFYAWTERQTAALQGRTLHELDVDNLAEELADLSGSIERSVESRLDLIIAHLVKLAVSDVAYPRRGWWNTVKLQRSQVERTLRKNPSLRRKLPEMFAEEWESGVRQAEIGLREDEAEELIIGKPWMTVEQAMTITDDAELRALAPRG